MTDPSLPALPDELEALLREERRAPEPPGVRDRLFSRLEATLPIGAPAPAAPAPRAGPTRGLAQQLGLHGAANVSRLLTAFALGGLAGGGLTAKIMHDRAERERPTVVPTPVEAPAPAPQPAVPERPPETRAPTPPSAPPVRATATRPHANPSPPNAPVAPAAPAAFPAAPPTGSGDLARQRMLLEQARVALGRGDASAALAALSTHEQQFPHSQLGEERDLLRIQVLRRAGDFPEVRARAKVFLERYPQSVFAPTVKTIVEEVP